MNKAELQKRQQMLSSVPTDEADDFEDEIAMDSIPNQKSIDEDNIFENMEKEKLNRINELARVSKERTLSEEEKASLQQELNAIETFKINDKEFGSWRRFGN